MAKKLPKLPFLLEAKLIVVGVGVGAEDGDMMLLVMITPPLEVVGGAASSPPLEI